MRTATPEHDLDDLFRTQGARLWRALLAFTAGRREIADDAVAEAFARALRPGAEIRDPVPWLYRTAFRLAAADLRRERREGGGIPLDAATPAEDGTIAELMLALRRLSPAQRAAVYLHYRADLPVREVAGLLGTSASAVRVHLYQGRRRLRALLGTEEDG